MDEIDSVDQPDDDRDFIELDDESTSGGNAHFPTVQELRWPLVLELRNVEGSAHLNELIQPVANRLGLTEAQRTETIKSGTNKLYHWLGWAGYQLRVHGILIYPSAGHRELTELGRTISESKLKSLPPQPADAAPSAASAGADLAIMVQRFRQDQKYPTEHHEEQKRLRAEWAEKLSRENIASLNRLDLSAILDYRTYGNPCYVITEQSEESDFIAKHEDEAYNNLLRSIEYLCWGDGDVAVRFDQVDDSVNEGRVGKSGFQKISGGYCSKLLAICHPATFLPITGQNQGNATRERALELLGLPSPSGKNFWHQSVNANDTLRDHLEPHFRDDTYGMAVFVYWRLKQGNDLELLDDVSGIAESDLAGLADRLLVGVGLLDDLVSLLGDKGQVILYGPPGTGKTYLAQKLAEELAPDESRRALVQFHPSTSYEDFFEGYRPAGTGHGGDIRYELTRGPLARMAGRASQAPGERHVMVIDEINRGNLPRVLGELLFLLEYRDESIHPLYRPDEPFKLPENLWFIGTMNTADRSIALVDAALRRRFHFVPFFPDRPPIQGLLGRWLAREEQPAWVGALADAVNDELAHDLDGSHLLLGPSHFMKDYGPTPDHQQKRLRRIWEYNIEPFIEDQFFGDPDHIGRYRFDAVYARHGPTAADSTAHTDEDAPPDTPVGSSAENDTEDAASEVGAS